MTLLKELRAEQAYNHSDEPMKSDGAERRWDTASRGITKSTKAKKKRDVPKRSTDRVNLDRCVQRNNSHPCTTAATLVTLTDAQVHEREDSGLYEDNSHINPRSYVRAHQDREAHPNDRPHRDSSALPWHEHAAACVHAYRRCALVSETFRKSHDL